MLFILICSADIVCAVQILCVQCRISRTVLVNVCGFSLLFLTRAVNKEHVGIIVIETKNKTTTMFNMRENYDFS